MSGLFHLVLCLHPCYSMPEFPSLSRPNNTAPVCINHILFIDLSSNGHLGGFHFLALVKNAPMNMDVWIIYLNPCFQFFWWILKAELLEHMVYISILCLQLWGATTLCPTAAALFYLPISNAQGFQFLSIFPNIFCFSVLDIAILRGVKGPRNTFAHFFPKNNEVFFTVA